MHAALDDALCVGHATRFHAFFARHSLRVRGRRCLLGHYASYVREFVLAAIEQAYGPLIGGLMFIGCAHGTWIMQHVFNLHLLTPSRIARRSSDAENAGSHSVWVLCPLQLAFPRSLSFNMSPEMGRSPPWFETDADGNLINFLAIPDGLLHHPELEQRGLAAKLDQPLKPARQLSFLHSIRIC